MESSHAGRETIRCDAQDVAAEVTIRFRPVWGEPRVVFSAEAQRDLNSTFGPDFAERGGDIQRAGVAALEVGFRRPTRRDGLVSCTFEGEVLGVRASPGASPEESAALLAGASRRATEEFFAALDDGRASYDPQDVDEPFANRPDSGFDEEFVARSRSFVEYAAERRPGVLFASAVSLSDSTEAHLAGRVLTPVGCSDLRLAIACSLYGCRPEADGIVKRAHELLALADSIGEKSAGDHGSGWGLGERYTALAYVHWLRTGETHEEALAKAQAHLLTYYRRAKNFDRGTANLIAPQLLFLGSDDLIFAVAKRLGIPFGRGITPPRGFFGDALGIATASDATERERLKAKLRRRMPLHLFRWMDRGRYGDMAFMLHALFPHPKGPPRRLIEGAWDFMPEIERAPGYRNWEIARKLPR